MMACFDRISYVKSIYMNLPIRTKTHKKYKKKTKRIKISLPFLILNIDVSNFCILIYQLYR